MVCSTELQHLCQFPCPRTRSLNSTITVGVATQPKRAALNILCVISVPKWAYLASVLEPSSSIGILISIGHVYEAQATSYAQGRGNRATCHYHWIES